MLCGIVLTDVAPTGLKVEEFHHIVYPMWEAFRLQNALLTAKDTPVFLKLTLMENPRPTATDDTILHAYG